MASTTLQQVENDWYRTRSGMPSNAPTTEHHRAYWVSKGITGAGKPYTQMEREWLQTLTGVTSKEYADMWVEAVAGQGLTPSKLLSENKFIFYSSVAGSP